MENDIGQFDKHEKLQIVNGLAVRELVIKGGEILICETPQLMAECALIVWYDLKRIDTGPLIVEFSFRYGDKKGKYQRESANNAYDLFLNVQEKMTSWLDPDANTKTGFLFKK